MVGCIFCSVYAIQNLLALFNFSWISAYTYGDILDTYLQYGLQIRSYYILNSQNQVKFYVQIRPVFPGPLTYVRTYVTHFAKTQHNDAFLKSSFCTSAFCNPKALFCSNVNAVLQIIFELQGQIVRKTMHFSFLCTPMVIKLHILSYTYRYFNIQNCKQGHLFHHEN